MSVALAVAAGVAWSAPAGATTAAPKAPVTVKLAAGPLGIDVAPWTNPGTLTALRTQLEAAHVTQIHYGGGTTADQYNWQNDTDISRCPTMSAADYAAACATHNVDALKFATFSQEARAIGAQSMVTVNYGTGTAAWAAALVKQAKNTPSQAVAAYEIGNENYGCWEPNDWIAGFQPNVAADCPMNTDLAAGMEEVATSYATHAATLMTAMKAQNASAQLVVPYANDGTVTGASVADNTEWNNVVIGDDAKYIGAVDEHWYPFGFVGNTGGANPTAQAVIQTVETIPSQYAKIEAALSANDDPGAKVIVGETGVSYQSTNVPCTPAGALFAAGDALEWLAAGAESIDWWPLNTDSNINYTAADCKPDEAMFTNPKTGAPQPLSPYTGYLLASQLAQPNARLSALTTSNPTQVLAFQSVLPSGQVAVAFINTNTSTAQRVTVGTSLTGNLATETYSAGNQNAANTKTVAGKTTAGAVNGGISLPAESIVVLKTIRPSALTLAASGTSVKAGTKVTLKGKLTLNGAAAPAGVTVKVTRQRSGSKAGPATLTAKTVAGGTFTVTNVPSAAGTYVYDATYTSSVYEPASHSVTVKVTAAKTAPKLVAAATAAVKS